MRNFVVITIYLLLPMIAIGQNSIAEILDRYNDQSIPYISVDELVSKKESPILLDSRETNEYTVSHLKNSIHVGYTHFNKKRIRQLDIDKNDTIVVYCSLGVRSEHIAKKLSKMGYTNVYNLYGGIFEWKNKDNNIINQQKKPTDSIHAFDKEWGKWLKKGIKTYN